MENTLIPNSVMYICDQVESLIKNNLSNKLRNVQY